MKKQLLAIAIALVLLISAAAGLGQAQQLPLYQRNFTLPFQVHWGGRILAPGNYWLTLDPASPNGLITIRGEGQVARITPRAIGRHAPAGDNALVVKGVGEVRTLEAINLADLDLILYYGSNGKQGVEHDPEQGERVPLLWIPQGSCPEYCLG